MNVGSLREIVMLWQRKRHVNEAGEMMENWSKVGQTWASIIAVDGKMDESEGWNNGLDSPVYRVHLRYRDESFHKLTWKNRSFYFLSLPIADPQRRWLRFYMAERK